MSDTRLIGSVPLYFPANTGLTVENLGPGTVYYGASTVTTSSYVGSISNGASVNLTVGRWLIASQQTLVELEYADDSDFSLSAHAADTTSVHGITDTSALALSADVAVIGEVLTLDVTYTTDEATTIQTALDNVKSQGGGKVLLPATDPVGATGVKIGSRIEVPAFVSLWGQGKYETELKCSAAGAGVLFKGVNDTPSGTRGGDSGSFRVDGNQLASVPVEIHSVNRVFRDLRVENPKTSGGIALLVLGAQNNNFYGLELEDQFHTASSLVQGLVFDGHASGNNVYGTSINEFTDGHVVSTATVTAGFGTALPMHNTLYGNMIERTDTGNPIIRIKCGAFMLFSGGNIATGEDWEPAAEYDIVSLTNDAPLAYGGSPGGSGSTRGIAFHSINFTGALSSGGSKMANVFRLGADLAPWYDSLYVDPSCKYSNCKYLARIDSGSVAMTAHGAANSAGGGLSSGWSNPSGAGKVNTRIISTGTTLGITPATNYYELTGSTTINSLAASYPEHQVVLKFSGAPTVSSTAGNIKLAGGVDMSATADDILCLICDGTNWHETSRVVK